MAPSQADKIPKKVLEERLFTKESIYANLTQRGSIAKCANKYRDFLHLALANSDTTDDNTNDTPSDNDGNAKKKQTQKLEIAKNSLIMELKLHDLEMKKIAIASKATITELQHYETISKNTQENIHQTRHEIQTLKQKLIHEQKVRAHREALDNLAKTAAGRPSCYTSKRKLEIVRSDIQELQKKRHKADEMIEMRRKQFQGLIQNIFDLKNSLEEEDVKLEVENEVKANNNNLKNNTTTANDNNDDGLYSDL